MLLSLVGCAHRLPPSVPITPTPGTIVLFEGVEDHRCVLDHISLDAKTGTYTVHCKGTQND